MATQIEPPPTWANVITETKDPATGKTSGGFNPIWLKWFLDLSSLMSSAGGASGTLSLTMPDGFIPFGGPENLLVGTPNFKWKELSLKLTLGKDGGLVGTISGDITLMGAPGTATETGGDASVLGGPGHGPSGNGGEVIITAGDSGPADGIGGSVTITAGQSENGYDSGVIDLITKPGVGIGREGFVRLNGQLAQSTMLVADLPVAGATYEGFRGFVRDGLAPVFGAIVVGLGGVPVPVYCDGVDWRVG